MIGFSQRRGILFALVISGKAVRKQGKKNLSAPLRLCVKLVYVVDSSKNLCFYL